MYEDKDPANTKVRTYSVGLGATVEGALDIGLVDDVELVESMDLKSIKNSRFGSVSLGMRNVGHQVRIKFILREIVLANLQRLMPWGSQGAGWHVAPPLGADLYSYAQVLVLHPDDVDDTSEDIVAVKAAPISGVNLKGNGEADSGIAFEFACFPDRDQLPEIVDVYVGALGGD